MTAISTSVGAVVLAVGGWVSVRTMQARRKVDAVSLTVTANESAVKSMQASMAAQLAAMTAQLTAMEERHQLDNDRCDDKLRRLGQIVKDNGGKVPDELLGLHAA